MRFGNNPVVAVALFLLVGCASSSQEFKTTAPSPAPKIIDWNRFNSSVILKTYRNKTTFICSAVLISENVGLTTAHCVAQSEKNEIVAGMSLTDPNATTFPVIQKSIRIHPEYDPKKSLSHADLALFRIRGTAGAPFAVIPEELKIQPGQSLDRISFGLRNGTNSRTWTQVFFEKSEDTNIVVTDALSVNGDSGSPLFDTTHGTLELVGLHTTLLQPSRLAAVNLAKFKRWISSYK